VPVEERPRPSTATQPALNATHRLGDVLRHPRAPIVALGISAAAAFVLVMYLGRGIGFYFDEWNFALDRRGHSLDTFLEPHNEHMVLVPVVVYKLLFAIVGLGHHWPYLAVLLVMHLLLGIGVYLLARPRLGPWPAVMAASVVLFAGLAWQNMIWPFQIGFVGSVLGGVWAFVALDRTGRRAELLACGALLFSIASSSLGVPMALGVGAEMLARGQRRSLWVAAVPLGLYVLWYLGYGESTITNQGVVHAAPWAMSAVAAAAGAVFGLGSNWGAPLAVAALAALAWRLSVGPPTPRLLGLLVAGVTFWALTGAARSVSQPPVSPESSRYLTFGVVVLLLIAVELGRGMAIVPRVLVLGGAITLLAVALGVPPLRDNAQQLRTITGTTDAELGAMQLVARSVPPSYLPDPKGSPQITAARYFAASRSFGSAGDSPKELLGDLSGERAQADRVLQEVVARLTPSAGSSEGAPPALEQATGGTPRQRKGCTTIRASADAPVVVMAVVPGQGIAIRAVGANGVEVKLRRFADAFANGPVGTIAPGQAQLLRLPADPSTQPYRVQLASQSGLAVCSA
jgi:hypothetical protein